MNNNEVKVYFLLSGFKIEPNEITDIIGINPTKTYKKGDKRTKKSIVKYEKNGWILSVEENNITQVDILFKKLLEKLSNKKKQIKSLINVEKTFVVVVYTYDLMPGICYDYKTIADIHEFEANIEHDIICL